MKKTGIKITEEDFEKMKIVAQKGWMPRDRIIIFSVGMGIRKDEATFDAHR